MASRVDPLASPRDRGGVDALTARLERGLMLLPASANVVMQLSRLPVGRAVAESKVASGSLMKRPLKRLRTTLAYIWIALYGTEGERHEMRRAVDAQHRHVRSRPDDDVAYDAYDADLQLWVAACMYVGSRQGYETLYGRANEKTANELLARCGRFATTLQVPAAKWPGDCAQFDAYWSRALTQVAIDAVTAAYLRDFVALTFLPRGLARLLGPLNRVLTGGYLAPAFRDALGLSWSDVDQRRFERIVRVARRVNHVLPVALARFPWNLVRYDTRRRIARHRPLL